MKQYQDANPEDDGRFIESHRLADLDSIANKVEEAHQEGRESGIVLFGGGEGHDGHRWAVDWMFRHLRYPGVSILLLEQDWYMATKEREETFLPLNVRLSMWSLYHRLDLVGVLPVVEEGVDANDHYERIIQDLGVDYSFATENDPNLWSKIRRGRKTSLFYKTRNN